MSFVSGSLAEDVPSGPNVFTGTVLINGTDAPVGTVIEAYIDYSNDQNPDGSTTVTTAGTYSALSIIPPNSNEDVGKTITFKVTNIVAEETSTFLYGPAYRTLNLNAIGVTALSFDSALVTYPADQSAAKNGDELTVSVNVIDTVSVVKNVILDASSINPSVSSVIMNADDGSTYDWDNDGQVDPDLYGAIVILDGASDGATSLTITAEDNVGNSASTSVNCLVDNTDPEVTIDTVNTPTNVSTQTIAGSAIDVNLASVTVNGVEATVSGDSYFATIALSEGENTVNVVAIDIAGNTCISTASILLDITSPVVNINAVPGEHVSVNNPVSITFNSSEVCPDSTEFMIKGDVVILEELVTEEVADGADYTFIWNATDISGQPVPSGDYLIVVNSTDTSGNTASKNITITIDNDKPTINIKSIEGVRSVGHIVYTSSTLDVVGSASGTPGGAADFEFVLESDFTTFQKTIDAELVEGNWAATFNMSSIPDDGVYVLSATAIDLAMNTNSMVSATVVIVDRRSPLMSSTISRFNETYGMVNVTSNEELAKMPVVEINGNPSELDSVNGLWSGIFQLDGEVYIVNVSGMDLAGNIGTSSSNALIKTVTTSNGTGTLSNDETGTSITFRTTEDTVDMVTVTESSDPLANTTDGLVGVHFIDVNLGDSLTNKLVNATIAIPVNEAFLPAGITSQDVSICFYNTTADEWEKLDTQIQTIDGIDYWVAEVDHFSTYAAIADDTVAPVLDGVTPSNGQTFEKGTSSVEIRFDYSDEQTGINASAIVFEFATVDVTNNENAQITGEYAIYNATDLSAGSYTASVTVFDLAGNSATFSTSFQIADSASTSTSSGSGSGGGGGGGGSTGESYENIAYKTVMSQYLNKDVDVSYEFDNEENGISYINFVSLKNSGSIKATIEVLNGKSSFADTVAPGKVYQTMNIWVGKAGFATEQNIENPTIGFKVEKSWLEENEIDASSISLFRYSNDVWNPLTTEKVDEDEKYVYFEANTPGFSPFAITSIDEGSEGVETNPEVEDPTDSEETDKGPETDSGSEDEESPKAPGFGSLLATGLVAVAYLVQRRK